MRAGTFVWPKGQELLRGVEMELKRGCLTALCGPSGAGKSTLVKILERKYPLSGGSLLLDGAEAAGISLDSWRQELVTVPETVKIFNGTLADNLLMGRDIPNPEWLHVRLTDLGMMPFLARFEAGLATPVGEDGRQLSSGERQVIGLIRALLERPSVLIMDEGINAVDVEIAGLILRTLAEYAREQAVLLISHNLRTLCDADRLYLLENRTIVEYGNPTELLARPGRFRAMWELQEAATLTVV